MIHITVSRGRTRETPGHGWAERPTRVWGMNQMTFHSTYPGGVANVRRTRLGAGWAPTHEIEPREHQVTDGPVANAQRSRAEEDPAGGGES
ncbi:hypothetical protein TPA0908_18940 [Micromonospora sp. AKA38]|nr:hypothetical protein TPA0908_18940 [Micromonospora sp. AKA38]